MKKTAFFFLAIFFVCVLSCDNSNGTTPGGPGPDPGVDFSGTWMGIGAFTNYKHEITGRDGIWYSKVLDQPWQELTYYTISWDGYKYMTSTGWRISINGNILTVEAMTYERQQ